MIYGWMNRHPRVLMYGPLGLCASALTAGVIYLRAGGALVQGDRVVLVIMAVVLALTAFWVGVVYMHHAVIARLSELSGISEVAIADAVDYGKPPAEGEEVEDVPIIECVTAIAADMVKEGIETNSPLLVAESYTPGDPRIVMMLGIGPGAETLNEIWGAYKARYPAGQFGSRTVGDA